MDIAITQAPPALNPGPRLSPGAPQLRTLLLTDLVDSTGIVERLGDAPASDLFRAHDHLVLRLQQQWRGRLIDRSDGLLLLFERPIDGLGFALDYARGLAELGAERGLDLRARAGLHVGEVLTWRNSDEAVRVGAKPLEVEGLAKPMAARLMAMARPGQILLSAVAEPLAHRAARELGERGVHLLWKSYGHWRFKGVPEPQQVFEVGEPGIAPLRMPYSTPKAWRDIPLWRRPAALAAEALLLIGGTLGLWYITRPVPAIAFNQRDWVVVGDLRNLTGQVALDDSLEQAFRISLEQSRHVNVISDLKARDTLARMRRPPDTVLDRAIASEIAIRDGARAVILPTVAEVGGRVRVSAEVIDPRTQTTVYAESADGRGVESALESIDKVTASLRSKLGEAVKSIERDSAPLPQVTTKNLDALRAYALGQKEYGIGAYAQALMRYEMATKLDAEFALAWLAQVRAHYALVDIPQAVAPLRRAQQLRGKLPVREALYLDGWVAEFERPADALEKWKELASLYPDYWPGVGNAATWLTTQNRFKEALPLVKRFTSQQSELANVGQDDLGRVLLGMEEYSEAAQAFDRAISGGLVQSLRRRADVDAAQRRFDAGERFLAKTSGNPFAYIDKISVALDQAEWNKAQALSQKLLQMAAEQKDFASRAFHVPAAIAHWMSGDRRAALDLARSAAHASLSELTKPNHANNRDDAGLALSSALVALRAGEDSLAGEVLGVLESREDLTAIAQVKELRDVLLAERARLAGRPEEAIGLLAPLLTGHEQYQTRVALMEAYAALGDIEKALEQSRWLRKRRGLAYIELGFGQSLQSLNVVDSNLSLLREAELLRDAGEREAAERALAEFDRLWRVQDLPDHLRRRRSELTPASSLGVV